MSGDSYICRQLYGLKLMISDLFIEKKISHATFAHGLKMETGAAFHFTFRHALVNFPKHFPLAEAPLPF